MYITEFLLFVLEGSKKNHVILKVKLHFSPISQPKKIDYRSQHTKNSVKATTLLSSSKLLLCHILEQTHFTFSHG